MRGIMEWVGKLVVRGWQRITFIIFGGFIMSLITDVQVKVSELEVALKNQQDRQAAKDAAIVGQIAALQATIDSLKNATVLSPADQAIVDATVVSIQGVVDKLNAASV